MLIVAAALALLAASTAAEAAGKEWRFTNFENDEPSDTLELSSRNGTENVRLNASATETWADPNPVAAPASGTALEFTYRLGFTTVGGAVNVSFGLLHMGSFQLISARDVDIGPAGAKDVASGVLGRVNGTLQPDPDAVASAGDYLAVRLTPTVATTLSTSTSGMSGGGGSTASIPLPELPALVLMGLGLVTVGGVAWARRGARWR